MPDPQFFVASVGNRGRTSLHWSGPFTHSRDARRHAKDLVRRGEATMSAVFIDEGHGRVPFGASMIYPGPARAVVQHWLEMTGRWERQTNPGEDE